MDGPVTYGRGLRWFIGLFGHFVQERTPDGLSSYKVLLAHWCSSMKSLDADDTACITDAAIVCVDHPDRYPAVECALE